jgi:methionine-gamma-lyase
MAFRGSSSVISAIFTSLSKFLNLDNSSQLKLIKLAVSLGSNESLAQHPHSMTHADVPDNIKEEIGINKGLIRLSVGIENANDIIDDLKQALKDI